MRLVARLDIKGPHLVKGIHLEGLRKLGDPAEHAWRYYQAGADEILYIDLVASLYGRRNLFEIVRRTAEHIFVPLIVGGGVRELEDIEALLAAGADKVAINTAATRRPALITEAARRFGSQCIVGSIEVKRLPGGGWEAQTDCGRERTGLDAESWAGTLADLGAGEILITSIDRDGTRRGLDGDVIARVAARVPVPVIASGGAGSAGHLAAAVASGADAVAVGSLLHYGQETVDSLKRGLEEHGLPVRR